MNYAEKLKDPRWQKKRLLIMERDNFTCRYCGTKEHTLHVHHFEYSGEPWETEDDKLITICEDCHWMHEQPADVIKRFQKIFRRSVDNGKSPNYCRRDELNNNKI